MKRYIYLLVVLSFLVSCHPHTGMKQQLVQIDSMANQKAPEEVLELLDRIIPETIQDEESRAYYWLLKIRTEIRLNKIINDYEHLDDAINYYTKHFDREKLARAYGYKGHLLVVERNYVGASECLKQAEMLVLAADDEGDLRFNIFYTLVKLNYEANEDNLAQSYAKRALLEAYRLGDSYRIAYSLIGVYSVYSKCGKTDSAMYYLNKCIPLVEDVPERERHALYANIGNAFVAQEDYGKAEEYLDKSLLLRPTPLAWQGLARVYYKRGESQRAKAMWSEALQTKDLELKSEILQMLYDAYQQEGDYKAASETALHMALLRDSIARQERADDIKGLQEQFELRQQKEAARRAVVLWGSLLCASLLVAVAVIVWLVYMQRRRKAELRQTKELVNQYHVQLKALRQEGKPESREVEQLKQKITDLQQKHGAIIENGRTHYDEIAAGGTTVRWSRQDFEDCVEYCRTQDFDFVTHMEDDYLHLSAKYVFFAILEHQGRTDDDLQRIMAIGPNTVRSYRSRINKAAKA